MPSAIATLNAQTLALAFVAGILAVLIFHQGLYAALYWGGVIPPSRPPASSNAPWATQRVPPLGVPRVISSAFWGGIWALGLWPLLGGLTGNTYWLAWAVVGGVALTLVFFFVVQPAKGEKSAFSFPRFAIGFLLNAAWGLGVALFMRYFG